MFCPVLLYAIYTASARHLTRLWNKHNSGPVVEFDGVQLPGVDDQTAVRYHNVCISYLIAISNDPAQSYNEDALTAATILRFYEQIDSKCIKGNTSSEPVIHCEHRLTLLQAPLTGQDSETYLNVVRAVVETQEDEAFYSIRKIHGPIRDIDPYVSPAVSLHHSACLMALRQEIWSVLLYRRSIQLPINPNNDFELIDAPPPADDFVWANRILVWTADVLKFCFGGLEIRSRENSNNPSPSLNVDSRSRVERWTVLRRFETTWQLQQPASFKSVYLQPSGPGHIFPEIWLNSEVQVLALQHFEIASLMLAVYDPRLPRLGLDAISAHRNLASRIRKTTLKLCGVALSNKSCPPAMVDAAVTVSMCGAYFAESSREEQNAIIRFLEQLELEHAWPTRSVVLALRESWFEGGSAELRSLPVSM